ncbi:MAG: signal peptidase I [Alphaproteobacteria bacterium]|nr:signal peptidase I [Alphaproteobacteria bacterium]
MQQFNEAVKSLAIVVAMFFAFTTVCAASYRIPSESMVPTLKVGDRVVVSKFAYGFSRFSLPLGLGTLLPPMGRLLGSLPRRGDVVVFAHPQTGIDYIKRVIALPGDTIEMRDGAVIINGTAVPRHLTREYRFDEYAGTVIAVEEYEEKLPQGRAHTLVERPGVDFGDNFPRTTIPEGYLFVMGDNRDNSSDSRFRNGVGLLPVENLIGRAEFISFSFAACGEIDSDCAWRALSGLH